MSHLLQNKISNNSLNRNLAFAVLEVPRWSLTAHVCVCVRAYVCVCVCVHVC